MRPRAIVLEPAVEGRIVRQCPSCRGTWPADWDYCATCAVWLGGTERADRTVRLAPVKSAGPRAMAGGTWLACEIRCDGGGPSRPQVLAGHRALEQALAAIGGRGGVVRLDAGLGLMAAWPGDVDPALDVAVEVQEARSVEARQGAPVGIAVGIGVVARGHRSPGEAGALARRLAALARADRALVGERAYERAVDRFDFRGVAPAVPRSAPLPGPVFELLGRKPERSGTHHVGPERLPLVGRGEILRALDEACRDVAAGRAAALHLVGEPGLGKSKVVREWMRSRDDDGTLGGWLQLRAHGVPYGSHGLRGWSRLVAPLAHGMSQPPAVDNVVRTIADSPGPALVVVDDLHWIDEPSRVAIEDLLRKLTHVRALVILAYRPSFVSRAPTGGSIEHRRVRLAGLDPASMRALVDGLMGPQGTELAAGLREEIVARSAGNALYAHEAVAHVLETRTATAGRSAGLPASLRELLMRRARWTVEHELPALDRAYREDRFLRSTGLSACPTPDPILAELDALEERIAAWLDRFDVIEEEGEPVVREFLSELARIDGSLALLSLLLGRQRPHRHRLAQAIRRLDAG